MTKKKLVFLHIAVFLVLGAYIFLSLKLRIYCPIKRITGFSCPACGSTRAIFSLLRLDIRGYMSYNPFALPLLFVLVMLPHVELFKRKVLLVSVMFVICAAAFLYNILRIV